MIDLVLPIPPSDVLYYGQHYSDFVRTLRKELAKIGHAAKFSEDVFLGVDLYISFEEEHPGTAHGILCNTLLALREEEVFVDESQIRCIDIELLKETTSGFIVVSIYELDATLAGVMLSQQYCDGVKNYTPY